MSFESFMALHYLKVKHQRKLVPMITILATLGVAVGVMVLVVVIAVMTGFQTELKSRILGIEAHMLVMRYSSWIDNPRQIAVQIESVEGVQSATPFIYAQGMLRTARGVTGIMLRGIDPENTGIEISTKGERGLAQMLIAPTTSSVPGIVLGAVLAEKLKLKVGQNLMLMVAGSRQANPNQLPRMHRLELVGLFDTGMHQYDGNVGFIRMQNLQGMLGISDLVTGIEVRVSDPDHVEQPSQKIQELLGFRFWTNSWKQMHRNLFSMLALQKVMMYVILTLIIVVAAFNVASALIMMVREKTKDIAILKTMGASNRSLKKVFLGKGVGIGMVGICLGVAAGLGVCFLLARYPFIDLPGDVYFLTTLPVQIKAFDLGGIVLGTLFICIFASLYPANQVAKMNPVDGIRYG